MRDVYNRNTPFEKTGESWDISCRTSEMGTVKNGWYAGVAFRTLIKKDIVGMLGERFVNFPRFPLLIKLIDANDDLSVQVHPHDEYAQLNHNYPQGKNEMWYILSAKPDSYLVLGIKDGCAKEDFLAAIDNNTIMDCLNKVYVSEGDCINIPAGLIHAIGRGIVLAEVQQNSDLTYRLYDYERLGQNGEKRELHIDRALDVIDFSGGIPCEPTPLKRILRNAGVTIYDCVINDYFASQILDVKSYCHSSTAGDTFQILICLKGEMSIEYAGGTQFIDAGTSVFLPAALGNYSICGHCRVMKVTPPIMP